MMKQPLFRQACELAFAECDSDGDLYISEQEVSWFSSNSKLYLKVYTQMCSNLHVVSKCVTQLGDSIRPVIPDLNEDEVITNQYSGSFCSYFITHILNMKKAKEIAFLTGILSPLS